MITDDEIRKIWRDAGGTFYGPNVEHGDMEEAKLLPFLRGILEERDAYKRAKAENDERFMTERDEARAELAAARAQLELRK